MPASHFEHHMLLTFEILKFKVKFKNTGSKCHHHIKTLNVVINFLKFKFKFKNTGSKSLPHIKTLNVVNFLKLKLKLKNTGPKWLCHICQQQKDLLTRFPLQARVILFIYLFK